jgi:hypothetical protein
LCYFATCDREEKTEVTGWSRSILHDFYRPLAAVALAEAAPAGGGEAMSGTPSEAAEPAIADFGPASRHGAAEWEAT